MLGLGGGDDRLALLGIFGQQSGAARSSAAADQTLALQQDALTKTGCERIFTDTASSSLAARPGLTEALAFARPGDTLVVWRLDRLGRSLRHLIDTISVLAERGIGFQSLQEQLDTTTSGGKLVFTSSGHWPSSSAT